MQSFVLVCYTNDRVCVVDRREAYNIEYIRRRTKLDASWIFSQTGPPRQVVALDPLWIYMGKVFFLMTQKCSDQFKNRIESSTTF